MVSTRQKMVDFILRHKSTIFYCGLAVVVLSIMFPEVARAVNLEDQLDRVNTLTTDRIKKYGVTGSVIFTVIAAIVRGNLKMVGIVVIIVIILALILAWVNGGMVV